MEDLNLMVNLINRKRQNKPHTKPVKVGKDNSLPNVVYAFISGVIVAELIILLIIKLEGVC